MSYYIYVMCTLKMRLFYDSQVFIFTTRDRTHEGVAVSGRLKFRRLKYISQIFLLAMQNSKEIFMSPA